MMTTENYPDIMLTAYYSSTISSIFFLAFIILIVFYLLAILLAIVFDNYKKRVEQQYKIKLSRRLYYIKLFYDQYDVDEDGYIDYAQARDFFQEVLDLNFTKGRHRKTFVKIIRIVDPENARIVLKERILEFFSISG